jgi:lycopene beta-cyclase
MDQFDCVLVGGGLSNAISALALSRHQPGLRVALIERGPRLGGSHTWCFHAGDVSAAALPFVEPLVVRRWSGYDVLFPSYERKVEEAYAAVSSSHLHDVVTGLPARMRGLTLLLGEEASSVEATRVRLASGRVLEAPLVVDARGPETFSAGTGVAYQKFVGLELSLAEGTAPARPILMDARVPQVDGFRFFYVLPLSSDRVLVEDTYYSDSPTLDHAALRREILGYARKLGLRVHEVERQESGVLPLPKQPFSPTSNAPGVVAAGYRGGWFHPTTGYSFPLAVRFAHELARGDLRGARERIARAWGAHRAQQRFCTRLNWMLFELFEPPDRFHVLENFYRLPPASVRRFYALATTPADRLRIFCARPPRGLNLRRLLARGGDVRAPALSGENG